MNCILGELYEIWTDTEHMNCILGELYKMWTDTEQLNIIWVSYNSSGLTLERQILGIQQN